MKIKALHRLIAAILCLVFALASFAACTKKNPSSTDPNAPGGKTYSNEDDPLVFSTLELDKVFNPFFATTAADNSVVGMTQISMLANDSKGNPVYGANEATVTEDLQIITQGVKDQDQTTTYYFVLKNNVKFSNGSPLTIKDVLFNLYVYLDPAYTGSSTIYSTDIVGLKEYRTQSDKENEQDSFMRAFEIKAKDRISALVSATEEIFDETIGNLTKEQFSTKLAEKQNSSSDYFKNITADYQKALELFRQELESDYSNSLNSYQDITFSDENGTVMKNLLTTDVEAFLYNEGYITWNKKDAKLTYSLGTPEQVKTWSKEQAINMVFDSKIPDSIAEVVTYWATASTLHTFITNQEMELSNTDDRRFENISGIKFANRTESVTVNGTTYGVPQYESNGAVKSGSHEVLSITINNIDPKAIWNFAFTVAPMYYYSDQEHINKFDFVKNFGVEYRSQSFMEKVIKSPSKIGVPVGAGPYVASKSSGGTENVGAGDFYSLGTVYFERNPHFVLGAPKIKKIRFQVVSSAQMLNNLYTNEIDYAEPNAKKDTIDELNAKKSEGIANESIKTLGYGYIGINAGKVPSMAVRQAIMHSMNTQECVDYYKTTASPIYRSMSTENWAYPKGATAYYPYIGGPVPENLAVVNPDYRDYCLSLGKKAGDTFTRDEQVAFIKFLVEDKAGYTLDGNGVYRKGNDVLKYTFTVAGEETDHPAWNTMYKAGQFLNTVGFNITVRTDALALNKLATGELAVWAAAWGSTIDPDMYQVYHYESNATSTLNWGYKQIKQNVGGKYDVELSLLMELSELIEEGRTTNDQSQRALIYAAALDIVMQLAIELPTYQRDDLFAYNAWKIDESSLTSEEERSSFKGLTSDIHTVSLVTPK